MEVEFRKRVEKLRKNPSDRFKSLAEQRVNRAIQRLRSIAKLANRRNYEYTEEQTRKIIQALKKEIGALEAAFKAGTDTEDSFSL